MGNMIDEHCFLINKFTYNFHMYISKPFDEHCFLINKDVIVCYTFYQLTGMHPSNMQL